MKYVNLKSRVFLRDYEQKMAYNAPQDELYEVDEEAFNLFLECNGTRTLKELKERYGESVDYLLSEGLIEESRERVNIEVPHSPYPSLRYILVHITSKCNLKCEHCYVDKMGTHMDLETFEEIMDQFYRIGGLKVMLSGGEPLVHPRIEHILKTAESYGLRVELLTNGAMINQKYADLIKRYVDDVQISIDGIKGHDLLRGEGSLEKTLRGIEYLDGVDITVATMITRYNIGEFEELEPLVSKIAQRWLLDFPCTDQDILPPFGEAARVMANYGFGKESYEGLPHKTCGAHLCAVTPEGNISRCGFYEDKTVGSIEDGLSKCWDRICREHLWDLEELECECDKIVECKGGCRYRAEFFGNGRLGKDPLMCHLFGLEE
ncbi:MAG: radical SAM protein [Archaeoglobaceae archaeon]